jgi:hypothetical protein
MNNFSLLIIIIIALTGAAFISKKTIKEDFNNNSSSCPNVLIQKGSEFYLYNSKRAKVPGVNPIKFNTLEDYTEFINWQRSQGIRCPILYLQQTYDTQGDVKYKVNTDSNLHDLPPELKGGQSLPPQNLLYDASRQDPPYNQHHYAGFDSQNQYIGINTPLDKMFHENYNGVSPNPMDTNWGGDNFTQNLVEKGFYKNREVNIYNP